MLAARGGWQTGQNRTPEERRVAAMKAITARWDKYRAQQAEAAEAAL